MHTRAGILLLLATVPVVAANRIGAIDFFGYKGIDVEKIRAALPVKVGDPFDVFGAPDKAEETRRRIEAVVEQATGRPATDVSPVCCYGDADWLIFIGLAGESSRPLRYRPAPQGPSNLPASVLDLHDRLMEAWVIAVQRGEGTEDRSQGYALFQDEKTRALQLDLRAWAVQHEEEIFAGIEASEVKHRRVAAMALGYANRSAKQVEALALAARDPDGSVRNNATRALGVLLSVAPDLAGSLDLAQFVAMLYSDKWEDRNKGTWLIGLVAAPPNEALYARLRAEAVDALREMAGWKSHGDDARKILERIGR